jgi:thioredoxin reductase
LFDENPIFGGQLRYRISELDVPSELPKRPRDLASALISRAIDSGVDFHPNHVVWGYFAGNELAISAAGDALHVQAEQVILATGSTDLPYICPGATLPGVLTARALQILMHVHRLLPGTRFAIVGSGEEASEVANDIASSGGTVAVNLGPDVAAAGITIEGTNGVQAIEINRRQVEVDFVVVAVGRQPDTELALMAGCDAGFDARLGGIVPRRDEYVRTSVEGLIVAGDTSGVCDVKTAIAEGDLAGLTAAANLGRLDLTELALARQRYASAFATRAQIATELQTSIVRA